MDLGFGFMIETVTCMMGIGVFFSLLLGDSRMLLGFWETMWKIHVVCPGSMGTDPQFRLIIIVRPFPAIVWKGIDVATFEYTKTRSSLSLWIVAVMSFSSHCSRKYEFDQVFLSTPHRQHLTSACRR
jgi:hypothetical protein